MQQTPKEKSILSISMQFVRAAAAAVRRVVPSREALLKAWEPIQKFLMQHGGPQIRKHAGITTDTLGAATEPTAPSPKPEAKADTKAQAEATVPIRQNKKQSFTFTNPTPRPV